MTDLLVRSGYSGPFIQGPTFDEGPNGQRLTTYVYTGTEAECIAQRIICKNSGAVYLTLGPKGDGNWELRSGYPFGIDGQVEAPSDVHELDTIVSTPSIWNSPRVKTLITPAGNLTICKQVYEDLRKGDIATMTAAEASIDASIADSTQRARCKALLNQVYTLQMDSFSEYNQVYRRTLTVSNPNQLKASRVGVGQIWTTAEVMQYEGLTAAWYFVLDSASVWLKSRPNVTTAARGKTQISYTYTEAQYASSFAYDRYAAAVETNYIWGAS